MPVPDAKVSRKGALLVASAALLWSSGGLFIKLAPMPPIAIACGRSIIAAVFYLLLWRPDLRRARWSTAIAYAGCILTFVLATRLTTAANAIFLQYTGPAYVLMLAPWLLGEKFSRLDALCVAASMLGMSLFFVGKVEAGQWVGNSLGVVSGVFFAFTILLLRRDAATGTGDAMPSTVLGNLIGFAIALPFAARSIPALTMTGVAVLLYLGVVQLGVAYWVFNKGVRTVPAAEASLICTLEPVFNPLWVLLGYGERPGPWALLGGGIVGGAVVLRTLWREGPPPRRANELVRGAATRA